MHAAFEPATLAGDVHEVGRIYAELFAGLSEEAWDRPAQRGSEEWTLHETIAHQCALNGAGLESVKHTLRGEQYTFTGLDNRYRFDAYNRKGSTSIWAYQEASCAPNSWASSTKPPASPATCDRTRRN
jgi:hypothetical protein